MTDNSNNDVFPDFAISLEEANRRIAMLQQYVREHMHEGEDYGIIPGSTKPTLFKPGAEKLNVIFGLAPTFEVVNRMEDWDHGFVSYEVKAALVNKRDGTVVAEGVGSCNSAEKRYRTQDAANIANTILKIAKKRAHIDATLSAVSASGLFTQDIEDMDLGAMRDGDQQSNQRPNLQAVPPVAQGGAQGHHFQPAREVARNAQPQRQKYTMTDNQRRCIETIYAEVLRSEPTPAQLDELAHKPFGEVTKSEASKIIDHLKTLNGEQRYVAETGRRNSSGPAMNQGRRYA